MDTPTLSDTDFWSQFFDDEREFAEIVQSQQIVVWERPDYEFGMGMKPSYGGVSAGKAGRLFEQWSRDPVRFEAERPRKLIDGVLEWGRDAEVDSMRSRAAWERLEKRLPTPPPGYWWIHMTGGIQAPALCGYPFLLWSYSLGYPPAWE